METYNWRAKQEHGSMSQYLPDSRLIYWHMQHKIVKLYSCFQNPHTHTQKKKNTIPIMLINKQKASQEIKLWFVEGWGWL